jgi:hypothetical protein
MAVDAATVAASDDVADMAERWRVHEEVVRKEAAEIAVVAESLLHPATQAPMTRWPIIEPPEIERTYNMLFMLHHSGALARLVDHAHASAQVFANNQGSRSDVWKTVFAADLGFTWRLLTGANPARTEPFHQLRGGGLRKPDRCACTVVLGQHGTARARPRA